MAGTQLCVLAAASGLPLRYGYVYIAVGFELLKLQAAAFCATVSYATVLFRMCLLVQSDTCRYNSYQNRASAFLMLLL